LVQKICAGAIKEINMRKLQVTVNDIDKESFIRIEKFLDEQMKEKAPKKIKKIE